MFGQASLLEVSEDTLLRHPLPRSRAGALVAALVLAGFTACHPPAPGAKGDAGDIKPPLGGDAAAGARDVIAKARALVSPEHAIPDRASTLAIAQSVEAIALQMPRGPEATSLHELAASALERTFRRFGRDQDGKEAVSILRQAAADMRVPGACGDGVRAALLAGETARDAGVSYAELYRLRGRLQTLDGAHDAGSTPALLFACRSRVEEGLTSLGAFRPPASVLAAIDQGLEVEGLLAGASHGAPASASDVPRLVKVEPIPGAEATRIVLVLSRSVPFHAGDVAVPGMGPPRTFVDLDGVSLAASQQYPLAGIVTRVHAEPTATGARVTLDLDGQAYRRVFYLPEPYRVVIDVARVPPGAAPTGRRRHVERVVLDPGHGGWDPGAIGPGGLREKEVTLDVARRVAPILGREGVQVLLTREDDRYVPLEERTARANAFRADLFVSVHCNAAENHLRHGVETYVLDTTKDEIESRVAARENATSQAATAELGSILASLRMADQATHSTHMAELLQRSAMVSLRDGYKDIHDGGVHTAGFYVLVGARMPSVLFETSYISNAAEETRLQSDDYRRRLADAIANAIRAYSEGR